MHLNKCLVNYFAMSFKFQLTPSSTTKNVRDIINAVENMYESVNSPPANCDEMDYSVSLKKDPANKKDTKQINAHLSDIVLNTMVNQGKNRSLDMDIPEPPKRSKPRNHNRNNKNSIKNIHSATDLRNKQNNGIDCSMTPNNKHLDSSKPRCETEYKQDNNIVSTTSGRPTAMDLAAACNGGKRSMWAELREVVESGVLGR